MNRCYCSEISGSCSYCLDQNLIKVLQEACKSALKVAELQEPIDIPDAIIMRANLITELVAALRLSGLQYREMTK